MAWDTRSHFEKRAGTYNYAAGWVTDTGVLGALYALAGPTQHSVILDLASGTGKVAMYFHKTEPTILMYALDISSSMLSQITEPAIETIVGDAHRLPFPRSSLDLIVCRQAFHYFTNPIEVLQEAHRTLRGNGRLVIGQITPFGRSDSDWWKLIAAVRQPLRHHRWTATGLSSCLQKAGFQVTDVVRRTTRESLRSWSSRYQQSQHKLRVLERLIRNAPEPYRLLHNYIEANGDVLFDSSWTLLAARLD